MAWAALTIEDSFTLSPDQKGIETYGSSRVDGGSEFTLSPDQKGIETISTGWSMPSKAEFTLSPDQKGIETAAEAPPPPSSCSH